MVPAPSAATSGTSANTRWKFAFAAFLLAYFVFFSWDGLTARFAPDDMMNMGGYFRLTPWQLFLEQFTIWSTSNRPMGGVFYMSIFHIFGLNPLPYHLGALALLGLNIWLAYRFAKALGCSELASGLAALVICYHAGLKNLQYNTDVIYDILCFTFYFGAFVYYARVRRRGRTWRAHEIVFFLALFLCALNSKEMAVTLPLALLAYEAIYHRQARWNWQESRKWLFGPGLALTLAAGLTCVSMYAMKFGPEAVMRMPAYQPVFSFDRLWTFQTDSIHDLLCVRGGLGPLGVIAVWVALTLLAWRSAKPALRFCWIFIVIAPLPVEFLVGRYLACLYIPLAGWAVFASVVLTELAGAIAATRFRFDRQKRRRISELWAELPGPRRALFAILILSSVFFWAREQYYVKKHQIKPEIPRLGQLTWEVIQQFRALHPSVPPHSEIVFLKDPFKDYDMVFIAWLWFKDRTLEVHLQRREALTAAELDRIKYQFTYENGKLMRVK